MSLFLGVSISGKKQMTTFFEIIKNVSETQKLCRFKKNYQI